MGERFAAPEPRRVQAMFDRIAARYDLMNRIMTLGRDGSWRRATVEAVDAAASARALDLGCGTGDLTRALARAGAGRVVGLDPVPAMLDAASAKLAGAKLADLPGQVAFVRGDALQLPFADQTFDCVVSAFVMRNVPDLARALAESRRVLRPGGRLGILELTPVTMPVVAPLFRIYFHRVVPLLGGLIAGDRSAYHYLPASVDRFPTARRLAAAIAAAKFARVRYRRFMFGTVALHVAER